MKSSAALKRVTVSMALCFAPFMYAQSDDDAATAQDVKRETRELLSTLGQYTADQRDQAIAEASEALETLDDRIHALEDSIADNWDTMTRQTREQARENLRALREQRNELAEQYGSFKTSSAEAWDEMKKGFFDSYKRLSESWENARKTYDKSAHEDNRN